MRPTTTATATNQISWTGRRHKPQSRPLQRLQSAIGYESDSHRAYNLLRCIKYRTGQDLFACTFTFTLNFI